MLLVDPRAPVRLHQRISGIMTVGIMRTTVTFDDDVAALLKREVDRRRLGLKQVLNDLLRRAFVQQVSPAKREQYRIKPLTSTGTLLVPVDNVAEALALAEDDRFK
ncbi:MAG: hypothetical protein HY901_28365 [Deltaproteobacteria bacterium]|nr:hypothetical protein [Deltaproteobacteria bacterium]